jgi:hypothetical protein
VENATNTRLVVSFLGSGRPQNFPPALSAFSQLLDLIILERMGVRCPKFHSGAMAMAEKVIKAKAPAARKAVAKKINGAAEHTQPRNVSHDEIRQLAHRYWAERGHPEGDSEVDWLRAEQELRGKAS